MGCVGRTIEDHPSLGYLRALLLPSPPSPPNPNPPHTHLSMLSKEPELTLFAPSDAAWSTLPLIERTYLESGFAGKDIELLLGLHLARSTALEGGSGVRWRETFGKEGEGEVGTVGGGTLDVSVGKKGVMRVSVRGREGPVVKVVEPDVLCKNGACISYFFLLGKRGAWFLIGCFRSNPYCRRFVDPSRIFPANSRKGMVFNPSSLGAVFVDPT